MRRYLILENGRIFEGEAFGASGDAVAEIVFTTAMTGYLETLTDKSYKGQAVVQTFPLIGNYGIIPSDREGDKPYVSAYIVREVCDSPSNFRCEMTLDEYLCANGIPGIKGIDTRALTRVLRAGGVMNGMITSELPSDMDGTLEKIRNYKIVSPVAEVTVPEVAVRNADENKYKVAMIDCGIKENIVRCLNSRGCELIMFPAGSLAEEILEVSPDGIFISNGPGDPTDNPKTIETLKQLGQTDIPVMGICLGHQLLALATGFKTTKLKYGHRGANHPVKDTLTGHVYITSQNHGYAVLSESVDEQEAQELYINVNDKTNEGLIYKNRPWISVQFHPESCGGPEDTRFIFDRFIDMMEKRKGSEG